MKAKYFIFPIMAILVVSLYGVTMMGGDKKCSTGCQAGREPAAAADEVLGFLPDVVAKIGDKPLTRADLLKEMGKMPIPSGQKLPDDVMKKIAKELVTALIDKNLLLEMAKSDGITPNVEMATKEYDAMVAGMPEQSLEMMKKQLQMQGMTLEQYKDKIINDPQAREGMAIDTWVRTKIAPSVNVTEKDVADFYEKHKDQFKKPETVTASHILIKPEGDTEAAKAAARKKLEAIIARLKKGENFGDIAEAESACPSGKAAKGSLGEFPRGTMTPKFEEAAFALKPGEISGVVETQFGYHVIKLDNRADGKELPLKEVSEYISENLKNMKVKERIDEALTKEKEKLNVKILI